MLHDVEEVGHFLLLRRVFGAGGGSAFFFIPKSTFNSTRDSFRNQPRDNDLLQFNISLVLLLDQETVRISRQYFIFRFCSSFSTVFPFLSGFFYKAVQPHISRYFTRKLYYIKRAIKNQS